MARIKKLKDNGATIYPATILDAVVDPSTNRKLSNTAIRYFTGGVGRYYKFMSFDIGGDKGMIRFGIISPLLGYGEFLINWGWQGAEEEKHCYPYCVLSTGSQMYNRVKLVRTDGSTFDAYFESNSGNDYATFVFMGQSGTSVKSFSASGVSSIPTVYKESAYSVNFYFGTITGTLAGTADSSKALVPRTETDINADVFKTPGIYVAPISMIDVSGSEIGLYGKSTIITIGNNDNSGYIEQVIITTIDDETKMFFRGWDLTTEAYEFSPLLPDIATSSKAGTVKSGGDITVGSDGAVTVNKAMKATQDGNGNNIVNTYATKSVATTSQNGLMPAADKAKLDGMERAFRVYGCFDNVDTYVDLSSLPKSVWISQAPIYFVSEDTEYQHFNFRLNYHFDSDNNTVSAYFVANDLDGAGIGLYYFENKKIPSNDVRFDFKAI